MSLYDRDFYAAHDEDIRRTAKAIVPIAIQFVAPKSVVDVGCGLGIWLAEFRSAGVEDVLGVDGDWVDADALLVPKERFRKVDLAKPLALGRRFDLVVSLEVAEHLAPDCAEGFVDSLAALGPAVLFSAAIPFQGGEHHVNERWQGYWAGLFERRGFVAVDCVRKRVWNDERAMWVYAQNVVLYAEKALVESKPELKREAEATDASMLSVVHPGNYLRLADPDKMSLRLALKKLPRVARSHIKRKLG